jgi:PEP-CTERM motif
MLMFKFDKILSAATFCFLTAIVTPAHALIIDDFNSGDLSAYTATRILKASGSGANVYSWEISGGALQLNTTAYDGIEQYALTRTDYSLDPGWELIADFSAGYTGTQDIGLYVGAGTPTPDVRADYVNIYMRSNGQLFSRGFNGGTEFPLSGGGTPAATALFIARTGVDTFDLGWYEGGVRNVLTSRTIFSGNPVGNSIGFYADIRNAGIVGNMDNLSLSEIDQIPEPATMALMGLGLFGFALMKQRSS